MSAPFTKEMFSGDKMVQRVRHGAEVKARLQRHITGEAEREAGLAERAQSNRDVAEQEAAWHLKPAEQVARDLQSSFEDGLEPGEAARRLELHGENRLTAAKGKSLLAMFVEQFSNVIVIILVLASVASMSFGEYIEGGVILAIVVINAVVSVVQEYNADESLAALKNMSAPSALVRRGGAFVEVPATSLVPGDVVRVVTGDIVPADIRLFVSAGLKAEEKALTGESVDVSKEGDYRPDAELVDDEHDEADAAAASKDHDAHHRPNVLFASTNVTAGNGEGLVIETGMRTRIGKIAQLLQGTNKAEAERVLADEAEKARLARDEDDEMEEVRRSGGGCCASLLRGEGTPLQQALHRMGMYMGFGALAICVVVFIVGVAIGHKDLSHPERPVWLNMVMVSVSLAVSGVPEGLPACVTLCLAMGMGRMVERHVIVRTLPAVETLGSASVICTDKTGTLTAGEMTAKALWTADGRTFRVEGGGFQVKGAVREPERGDDVAAPGAARDRQADLATAALVLCNTAALQEDAERGAGAWKAIGGSTERPLVVLGAKMGMWKDEMDDLYERVHENAYSSQRKMMSTVHRMPTAEERRLWEETRHQRVDLPASSALPPPFPGDRGGDGARQLFSCVKGAPNVLLRRCTRMLAGPAGETRELDDAARARVTEQIDAFSDEAYRVLAVAYREMPDGWRPSAGDDEANTAACEGDLVLVGLVASQDPERPEVIDAIETARQAGIRTVMITGDYLNTARAIALNINLLDVRGLAPAEARAAVAEVATDCSALREEDEDGQPLLNANGDYVYKAPAVIDELTRRCVVFARAQPQDKFQIVQSLQNRQGEVCAMTGDGVNDAPALKEAAIGVAMGLNGTETAKQAADMVLTDDNFASIVLAVEEGRVIYANITKFVSFLLSTNFAEILVIFITILAGLPSPLEPLQILFLNLASDGLPALALSREEGEEDTMRRPPRPAKQEIIHSWMWIGILANSVALMVGALIVYVTGLHWHTSDAWDPDSEHGIAKARTMSFVFIAFSEYLRAFTVRSQTATVFRRDVFGNRVLVLCIAISISLLSLVMLVPGPQSVFGFAYIGGRDYAIAFAMTCLPVATTEVVKVYLRRLRAENRLAGFETVGSVGVAAGEVEM